MSDIFRKTMDSRVGPGGVKCYCCNDFAGKDKPKLRRTVRRIIKINDSKLLEE
jgi:hypothetical protein